MVTSAVFFSRALVAVHVLLFTEYLCCVCFTLPPAVCCNRISAVVCPLHHRRPFQPRTKRHRFRLNRLRRTAASERLRFSRHYRMRTRTHHLHHRSKRCLQSLRRLCRLRWVQALLRHRSKPPLPLPAVAHRHRHHRNRTLNWTLPLRHRFSIAPATKRM